MMVCAALGARGAFAAYAIIFMTAGLVWRLVPLHLPLLALRYGGAAFWGAMVFCLVAAARPARSNRMACLAAATIIAVGLEFFRLYHAPGLDAFRATLAGALLIGRVFSVWNMVAYEAGIIAAGIALWPAA